MIHSVHSKNKIEMYDGVGGPLLATYDVTSDTLNFELDGAERLVRALYKVHILQMKAQNG